MGKKNLEVVVPDEISLRNKLRKSMISKRKKQKKRTKRKRLKKLKKLKKKNLEAVVPGEISLRNKLRKSMISKRKKRTIGPQRNPVDLGNGKVLANPSLGVAGNQLVEPARLRRGR